MDDAQREVAAIALAAAGEFGFVLAGGNAIAMHGIGDRPSEDLDLFTNVAEPDNFRAAVDGVLAALVASGWHTESRTGWDTFAQITASKNDATVSIDMGLDYRASPPATMTIGPVLALRDAAANKMSALYSRALPRDFLDIDALIASRRFTPAELLGLADDVEALPMDRTLLMDRLRLIERFPDSDFTAYGVSHQQIQVMRARFAGWAEQLAAAAATSPAVPSPPSDRDLPSDPLPDGGPDL